MYKYYLTIGNERVYLNTKEAVRFMNMPNETMSNMFEIKSDTDYGNIKKQLKKEWFYEPFINEIKRKIHNIIVAIKY